MLKNIIMDRISKHLINMLIVLAVMTFAFVLIILGMWMASNYNVGGELVLFAYIVSFSFILLSRMDIGTVIIKGKIIKKILYYLINLIIVLIMSLLALLLAYSIFRLFLQEYLVRLNSYTGAVIVILFLNMISMLVAVNYNFHKSTTKIINNYIQQNKQENKEALSTLK